MGKCVDRFYASSDPLLYRIRITFKISVGMVTYPWVHAAAFGLGTGLGIDVAYDPISKDCGLGWRKRHIALSLFLFLLHVLGPFLFLLVSNVLLFCRLKSHNERLCRLLTRNLQIVRTRAVRRDDLSGKLIPSNKQDRCKLRFRIDCILMNNIFNSSPRPQIGNVFARYLMNEIGK